MPIYDLSDPDVAEEAKLMLGEFQLHGKTVELKVHRQKRSNPQNRSLYLLLGYMSNVTGYTIEECKMLYKEMNKAIYTYFKPTMDGEDVKAFIRSSADLDTAEMAKSIDTLYRVCGENGIELPLLTNEVEMLSLERENAKNSHWN